MSIRLGNKPATLESSQEAMYQDILRQWDDGWTRATFPHLHTTSHWAYAKARLSAFRSLDEWLTIFELLAYYAGLGDYEIVVSAFGNKLQSPGFQDWTLHVAREEHSSAASITEYVRRAMWGERSRIGRLVRRLVAGSKRRRTPSAQESAFGSRLGSLGLHVPRKTQNGATVPDWDSDPFDFEVALNGELRRFCFTPADYVEAGIRLDGEVGGDEGVGRVVNALRVLAHHLPADQVFYPTDVLLTYVGRPPSVPALLQLCEWCHPGIGGIQMPSDSPCLRSLARAVAQNAPSLYACPTGMVNTHWSRWPQLAK